MSVRVVIAAFAALISAGCATSPPAEINASRVYADFLIGRVANAREDYSAAADRYFSALARSPGDDALLRGALAATLAAGDETRARRAAAMAPREDAPALARLVRGAEALRGRDWRRAERELSSLEGTAVEEMLARTMEVWMLVGRKDTDEAIANLAPLTSIRPYGALFLYQQAMAMELAGRNDISLVTYGAAARGEMFLPPAVERHVDALVRAGRGDEARELLAHVNAARGNVALEALAARLDGGANAGLRALTPARASAVGLYGFAAILMQQEYNAEGGLIALTLALILDPDLDAGRLMFAEGHADDGRYDLARRALARVPASSPYAQSARIMESRMILQGGEEEAAIASARANADTGAPRARRALADMYVSLDRYGDAEPIYSSLLDEDNANWRLHFARGAARERLGRWEEAELDFRRALELSPDQPDVLNYLGYSWVDRGVNLDEGLAMIRRAVELRPTSGAIVDSLGWAYFRLGDYRQAILHLERAVELEPGVATLNDHLGDAYWRDGRRTEARFQWRRALSQNPDDPEAIEQKLQNGLPE